MERPSGTPQAIAQSARMAIRTPAIPSAKLELASMWLNVQKVKSTRARLSTMADKTFTILHYHILRPLHRSRALSDCTVFIVP
jgi:hypothetical protein